MKPNGFHFSLLNHGTWRSNVRSIFTTERNATHGSWDGQYLLQLNNLTGRDDRRGRGFAEILIPLLRGLKYSDLNRLSGLDTNGTPRALFFTGRENVEYVKLSFSSFLRVDRCLRSRGGNTAGLIIATSHYFFLSA